MVLFLLCAGMSQAQVVDGISYQAVAVDKDGKEIPGMDIEGKVFESKEINLRFTIIAESVEGPIVYQETQITQTDPGGLFSVVIGHGTPTVLSPASTLLDVDWGANKHFLKVELDIDGAYRGNIKAVVDNKTSGVLPQIGDRLFQLVAPNLHSIDKVVVVDTLSETSRGAGGFGPTGK